jgi:methylthioribose-1-phosphate isomerase
MKGEDFAPLRFRDGALELLDQTLLPSEERWVRCTTVDEVADAIRRLAVRGAPAIGVAAGYGLVLGIDEGRSFDETHALLASTRPTAVNLRWALDRGRAVWERSRSRDELLDWARDLQRQDLEGNRRMAEWGAPLFAPSSRVLTHCNAGALATAGIGTAIGVVTEAWRRGAIDMVWVDETRPLLQGARLTAWELRRLGIPHRLITDSSAGALFARGLVDGVVVGADRIAANGDTANKIGTYTVAVLAHRHGVPFYVAAPLSTIDPATPNGAAIPIEERASNEVTELAGRPIAPSGTEGMNFAFDVTPAELIAAIITDVGVLRPPYRDSIRQVFESRCAD